MRNLLQIYYPHGEIYYRLTRCSTPSRSQQETRQKPDTRHNDIIFQFSGRVPTETEPIQKCNTCSQGGGNPFYPFTAPPIMPRMKSFMEERNRRTRGMLAMV